MDEITIGDKIYISSKQAAKITGYAKDYVGQLCREGRVEARLVGRNWYVLESSIREHRFGAETVVPDSKSEDPEDKDDVAGERSVTWERAVYQSESPTMVPELAPKTVVEAVESQSAAIADMQSAWREWFSDKNPVQALPDGSEDFKEEYLPVPVEQNKAFEAETPEMVTIQRINAVPQHEEATPKEENIELHRSYASRETGEQIPHTAVPVIDLTQGYTEKKEIRRKEVTMGSGTTRAVLVVVALAAVMIAVIGTGNAERFIGGSSIDFGIQKSFFEFLGGKSTYKSTL